MNRSYCHHPVLWPLRSTSEMPTVAPHGWSNTACSYNLIVLLLARLLPGPFLPFPANCLSQTPLPTRLGMASVLVRDWRAGGSSRGASNWSRLDGPNLYYRSHETDSTSTDPALTGQLLWGSSSPWGHFCSWAPALKRVMAASCWY